ncbi:MAG: ADP-ribosylation/crystallin J1 [Prochloraceae cyanobacterium]|nr:ADP-ribosylation/crystallin J1 [Prochloraceae cyanobacterium]
MLLYRPVGLKQLELIAKSGFTAFPPRLPEQPIFYPVLNFEYAEKIAKNWNTKTNTFAGFVTKFEVKDEYISNFKIHTVGSKICQELWIPAAELAEFNLHILGKITIESAYYGE